MIWFVLDSSVGPKSGHHDKRRWLKEFTKNSEMAGSGRGCGPGRWHSRWLGWCSEAWAKAGGNAGGSVGVVVETYSGVG